MQDRSIKGFGCRWMFNSTRLNSIRLNIRRICLCHSRTAVLLACLSSQASIWPSIWPLCTSGKTSFKILQKVGFIVHFKSMLHATMISIQGIPLLPWKRFSRLSTSESQGDTPTSPSSPKQIPSSLYLRSRKRTEMTRAMRLITIHLFDFCYVLLHALNDG